MFQSGYITLLFFGFPAGIISLTLSAIAVWKRWPLLMIVAGLFTITETIYASLLSRIPFYILSLFQFYGAYTLKKGNGRLTWYLLIPVFLFTAYFAYFTILNFISEP